LLDFFAVFLPAGFFTDFFADAFFDVVFLLTEDFLTDF